MIRGIQLTAALLMITGCTLIQSQTRSEAPLDLPQQFSLYHSGDPTPGQWWRSFASAELDCLVGQALSGNFDVRTAWTRLKQADAAARQAGAAGLPTLDYNAGFESSLLQTQSNGTGSDRSHSKTFSAGLRAAYEVDLWGRLDALQQSETTLLQAAAEDLESAAVSVSAEVVISWINVLSVRRQIRILQDQIQNNQSLLSLLQLRFVNGQAGALDVSQQLEALAMAKAKLPLLQLREQQQLNALAVLLGIADPRKISITQAVLPDLIPTPETGVPIDLLGRRPDVRAAGLRLGAADWQVTAARAARLPSLTLSAEGRYASTTFDLLFSNWIATLAASITGPLLDGGYLSAEVDRTRAVAEEYLSEYARTVATAIQEVEDRLAAEQRQGEYIVLLEQQLDASRLAMKYARIQYMNGQNNYLNYLTAWTSVQDLERQLIEEQATRLKNRVNLHRSVGGDWTREWTAGADARS